MDQPLKFSEHFYIDKNLHDLPKDPESLKHRIEFLHKKLTAAESPKDQAQICGEIGGLYRCLKELDLAESFLNKSLALIESFHLGARMYVVHSCRLANVLQWKKQFAKSNSLFNELLNFCSEQPDLQDVKDFVYQHHGKNLFDQENFDEALRHFQLALQMRKDKGHPELIESTQLAIDTTLEKLTSQGPSSPKS